MKSRRQRQLAARHQGLSRAGRADEQDAPGNTRPQALEFLPRFQKFDHFTKVFLGFIYSGHVIEGNRGTVGRE